MQTSSERDTSDSDVVEAHRDGEASGELCSYFAMFRKFGVVQPQRGNETVGECCCLRINRVFSLKP